MKVEVLLQKHSSGRNDPDPYGFVSFLEAPNKPADLSTIQFFLSKYFVGQCGSSVPWAATPEAPPLIPVGHLISKGVYFMIFVIPRAFNSWAPQPAKQFPYLNYSTEAISINNSPYSVHSGHVWVEFNAFVAECGNQLVLNYKDKLICRFGSKCRHIDSCGFLHVDSNQLPRPVPNSMVVEKEVVQFLLSSSGLIGNLVITKLLQGSNSSLYDNKPFNVSQDPNLQVEVAVSQQEFYLDIKNLSTVQIQLSLSPMQCPSASITATLVDHETNKPFALQRGENLRVLGKVELTGYYSLNDLPSVDVYYKTADTAHRMRVKIPVLLHKYCADPPIPNFDPNGSSDSVKKIVQELYNSPRLVNKKEFTVEMGAAVDKASWATTLREAGVMVCAPFVEQNVEYFCVVSCLKAEGIVIIMNFFEESNQCFLKVVTKFGEESLYTSFAETICAISSNNPCFEYSLLDPPPFTN
eukprot:CAMPEP_0206193464 /NCGR_PEP_ID=MMETSP0166-20121206/6580_1 /ASSEMBLY_ACC=CAM_ASM_000260 /TAXON_ID=95228 /ORGANISM="Vannella robusta, Strain DIVA3 518/3/11/1/6" /LENGTH=466 /DNA_ID=CAMNT_0053610177 /DNA_START=36 /DNA_END=1437 /DNA_ORIENTATION=+